MRPRLPTVLHRAGAAALCLALGIAPGQADHGGPLRSAPMSPLMVAFLAAVLTLAALGLIALVVRILIRAKRAAE